MSVRWNFLAKSLEAARAKPSAGKSMKKIKDLLSSGPIHSVPPTMLVSEAIEINEKGLKPVIEKSKDKELDVPLELQHELDNNPAAKQHFKNFPYYKKKEYTEWIKSAKRETTKLKRLNQAIV